MGDCYDRNRGHRAGYERRQQLEIVNGKEFSANQSYVTAYRPPRPRSPEPPYPRAPKAVAAPSSGSGWGCFSDPELKRRRRVAGYKAYAMEGKVKASIRRGIRWIKHKCSEIVHGW